VSELFLDARCDVTPCSLVEFAAFIFRIKARGSTLSFEMLVTFYHTTWHHIIEHVDVWETMAYMEG
jgi:hypothetical protein